MIYPVVLYGDPVLKQKAKSVNKNDLDEGFIDSMFETMYGAGGVGLAAPQIGMSIRVFIVDSSPMEDDGVEGSSEEGGVGGGGRRHGIRPLRLRAPL